MRFASLGSGSRGNATVIEHDGTRLLLDCGFSLTQTERRLQRLGLTADTLTAIVVTHEHGDHLRGVAALARRFDLPVWLTPGTWTAWKQRDTVPTLELFSPHEAFAVGDIELTPYTVPHDAREPCQFVFCDGDKRLGVLSDAGRETPHMRAAIDGCDALLLECNHDPDMLAAGPYPPHIKQRVGGPQGHLSNGQAGAFLASLETAGLQHIVAAHISEKNNSLDLVRDTLAQALGCTQDWIGIADQTEGLAWRTLT